MRKTTLAAAVVCVLMTIAGTPPAQAKRYWAHRSGPEILVVPGYGAPQVYVRRYEGLVFEYVPRRYHARRYAACAYPRRTVHVCRAYRRH